MSEIETDNAKIWESRERINVFISYKDNPEYNDKVADFLAGLEKFGVCGFLASRDIKPTQKWEKMIRARLQTTDVLIALMTDDFHKSEWTGHEIGAAIGAKARIIPIKLGKVNPDGIIRDIQAYITDWDNLNKDIYVKDRKTGISTGIIHMIYKEIKNDSKIIESIIGACMKCRSYYTGNELCHLLPYVKNISDKQVKKLIIVYWGNHNEYDMNQLKGSSFEDELYKHLQALKNNYADDVLNPPDYCSVCYKR